MSITPPQFDPHADSIDGPAYAWSDPEISRLDLMENREWVRVAVARSKAAPYQPIITITGPEPRKPVARMVSFWIATVAGMVALALLIFAVVVSQ
jgi:hypothetical protein